MENGPRASKVWEWTGGRKIVPRRVGDVTPTKSELSQIMLSVRS
jgi:hypothetical protein